MVQSAISLRHSQWYSLQYLSDIATGTALQYLSDIMIATCRKQETLGRDALEQRTLTGSGRFTSSGSGFDKFWGKSSF